MKFKIFTLLAMLAVLLGMAAYGQAAALAVTPSGQEPPLRLSEPLDDIITDLESYIPERMREDDIPGLSIALIRNGQIVWTEGFGVTNVITDKPVTPGTVFEVASISKVVTAYTALRLVEQGKLSLDEPLNAYLSEPWLPPSDYADRITLRHLASHSSGLTDGIIPSVDKSIAFEPGSDFLYSGVGALYVQEAIEQVTGKSLEDAAREAVFEPLGMSSSSFANKADVLPRMANGHMGYIFPLLAFVVPFAVILISIGLLGVVVLRIRMGQWRPTRKMVVGACVVATILTLLILAFFLGKVNAESCVVDHPVRGWLCHRIHSDVSHRPANHRPVTCNVAEHETTACADHRLDCVEWCRAIVAFGAGLRDRCQKAPYTRNRVPLVRCGPQLRIWRHS